MDVSYKESQICLLDAKQKAVKGAMCIMYIDLLALN